MQELNYNQDVKINKHDLVMEWENQPYTYSLYSDAFADTDKAKTEAKENLELITAQEFKKLQDNPPVDGNGKPRKMTVKDYDMELAINDKILQAKKDYNQACYECTRLAGMKTAFEHRKKALEKITDLWSQQYFGTPKSNESRSEFIRDNDNHRRAGLNRK